MKPQRHDISVINAMTTFGGKYGKVVGDRLILHSMERQMLKHSLNKALKIVDAWLKEFMQ